MVTDKIKYYTTQLQAGLGVIEETRTLLELWEPEMNAPRLFETALQSGSFPNVSARRLRNLVSECFAPRFLVSEGVPAIALKKMLPNLTSNEFSQFLFLFTCRANSILADFVIHVIWNRYLRGYDLVRTEEARDFVIQANQQGKTVKPWSESTIRRVASYLIGCCYDFGILGKRGKMGSKINSVRLEPKIAAFLAYDLHFSGLGDNSILGHLDWRLFGMEYEDVRNELKRLALKGFFIYQTAGDIIHIGWNYRDREEFTNVIAKA